MNGIKIIGVDHGYGNIKTANCCFPTGIASYNAEPRLPQICWSMRIGIT